eukprot:1159114-Pelagomonas_calceolata.AAC.12
MQGMSRTRREAARVSERQCKAGLGIQKGEPVWNLHRHPECRECPARTERQREKGNQSGFCLAVQDAGNVLHAQRGDESQPECGNSPHSSMSSMDRNMDIKGPQRGNSLLDGSQYGHDATG